MRKSCCRIFVTLYFITSCSMAAYAGQQVHSHRVMESPNHTTAIAKGDVSTGDIDTYTLDSGDKIKIHVFGEKDMDVEVRLGVSGNIRYPFLGKIHVAGMTLPALEHKISTSLNGRYLIDPQVRVSMEEFRPFYVNGEVKSPGAYPFQPGLTVRKAISLAGGLSENADENKLFLIRANKINQDAIKVNLGQMVLPGDIVSIKKSFFFVNGEVKHPDKYIFKSGMTYRMAISMAGGLTDKADIDTLTVIHAGKKKHRMQKVGDIDTSMAPDDVITIKQSFF